MEYQMLKDVLKAAREKLGMKQSEVAEIVGVTTQTYLKWENGHSEPKISLVGKLSKTLKVSEKELCHGVKAIDDVDMIDFMQRTSANKNGLDDVTFTKILYSYVDDKKGFLEALEKEKIEQVYDFHDFEAYEKWKEEEMEMYLSKQEKALEEHQKLNNEIGN